MRPAHFLALLALLVSSCAGYQLGGRKPAAMAGIESINVALVDNKTQFPRAGAFATSAITDALLLDGTYRLANPSGADARLIASLHSVDYRQVRSNRRDSQRSEELEMRITYNWQLVDAGNPLRIIQQGRSIGRTTFFVDPNLQTAQQTALPDALKRAAESMVAQLADGF